MILPHNVSQRPRTQTIRQRAGGLIVEEGGWVGHEGSIERLLIPVIADFFPLPHSGREKNRGIIIPHTKNA